MQFLRIYKRPGFLSACVEHEGSRCTFNFFLIFVIFLKKYEKFDFCIDVNSPTHKFTTWQLCWGSYLWLIALLFANFVTEFLLVSYLIGCVVHIVILRMLQKVCLAKVSELFLSSVAVPQPVNVASAAEEVPTVSICYCPFSVFLFWQVTSSWSCHLLWFKRAVLSRLKVAPKKPPRKKPPQSSAMVKVEGLDKKDTTFSSDVHDNSSCEVGEFLKMSAVRT